MQKLLWSVFLFIILVSCKKGETAITPTLETISQSVYVSVTVQPDSLYEAFASVNGILESNLVTEGSLVKEGTPLFQIINSNTKLNTENARLAYNLAQKNYSGNTTLLLSIKDELKAAELKRINDSINFFRQKNLWEKSIGSKAQFDAKQLEYQLSKNTVESIKNKYQRTKNELETQLNQASNTYQNSVITTGDFTVTSKMNGKVYALYKNPGEIVTPQLPLAMLGSKDNFILELLVDEVDIVSISNQQKVVVTLDAYPDQIFLAAVSKIYPNKDERNQTFKVEAKFENPPKTLYPGLSGEGNIIISVKENALTIPAEYLFDKNKVNTKTGIVEVIIGVKSDDKIEILSGITSEAQLLKPDVE